MTTHEEVATTYSRARFPLSPCACAARLLPCPKIGHRCFEQGGRGLRRGVVGFVEFDVDDLAHAVLIGRPYLYGLAVNGAEGGAGPTSGALTAPSCGNEQPRCCRTSRLRLQQRSHTKVIMAKRIRSVRNNTIANCSTSSKAALWRCQSEAVRGLAIQLSQEAQISGCGNEPHGPLRAVSHQSLPHQPAAEPRSKAGQVLNGADGMDWRRSPIVRYSGQCGLTRMALR